jgi:hypothetical protein
MIVYDQWDDQLIGTAEVWHFEGDGATKQVVAVYDAEGIAEALMADGMTEEEAREYISFNIEGAYVGPTTPILVWRCTRERIDEMVDEGLFDE